MSTVDIAEGRRLLAAWDGTTITPRSRDQLYDLQAWLVRNAEALLAGAAPDLDVERLRAELVNRLGMQFGDGREPDLTLLVVEAVTAALSGSEPVDSLDAETLAKAIQSTILTSPDQYMGPGMGAYRALWENLTPANQRHVIRDAEALIAEYRRLREAPDGR
jgi:hypothetical protein